MSFHFPLARWAGPALIGVVGMILLASQAQTMPTGGGAAPPALPDHYFPADGMDVVTMDEAASLVEPPPNSRPVQFPLIREEYGYPAYEAPARLPAPSRGGYPMVEGTNQPPYKMPWMTAKPPAPTPQAGMALGTEYQRALALPGNPAALSIEGRKRFRRMLREARSKSYAFTGRLMKERDALEVLYENDPYPEPEEVGEIYGRIFAVQREMVEDRVRRTNALRELFQRYRPRAREPQPASDPAPGEEPDLPTPTSDPS